MVKHNPKSVLILWLRFESLRFLGDNALKQSCSVNKIFHQCSLKTEIIFLAKVLVNWRVISVLRMVTVRKEKFK